MSSLRDKIDFNTLPNHVAIIMDGNGRWAKKGGMIRVFGHKEALKAVRETLEGGVDIGLKYITLFTFSTENWNRPKTEVKALMELLLTTIRKELPTFMNNNIRLRAIGDLDTLPEKVRRELDSAMGVTEGNTGLTLTLALSYGGRWDILQATKKMGEEIAAGNLSPENIDENTFRKYLSTNFLPDPELMIRTSGEFRISNFLLWELAYAEIFITQKLWPEFRREDLFEAIVDFQKRERRFGKTSEQLKAV